MAKKINVTPETPDPFANLPEESLAAFEGIEAELDEAEKDQEAMEQLGMDTSRNMERIEWARKAIKVMRERIAARKV